MMDGARQGPRNQWGAVLLALAALIGAAVIGYVVYSTLTTSAKRDSAIGSQQRSYEVMILARDLDATIASAEATLGRFVISGDRQTGQLYADRWQRARTLLDAMAAQPGRNVNRLRQVYDLRGQELGDVALRTTYGQNAQALAKYYAVGKSPTLGQLRVELDALFARERATLAARTANAELVAARSDRFAAILAVFGLILTLGASVLGVSAWLGWRERRDEELRNLILEDAVAMRTAELRDANAALRHEMETREATETQLRQAQKMEAVGQLTGGIAHDFNNMLGVVIGGIELAQRRLATGRDDALAYLDRAMEGANRAATLTRRLLAFARAEPLMPSAIDPNALIATMAELLDRTLGDTIEIAVEPRATASIFVDAHQLENVLLNLAVNARDAMPDGGLLTLVAADAAVTDDDAQASLALAPGDYVTIAVRDTGVGMPPEVVERATEPFFTTKPHGRGTGLGLSQVFGFARQSEGNLVIDSAPGAGTCVTLYLPRHAAAATVPATARATMAPARDRHAGLPTLVIEDDPRVLAATVGALTELGYEAIPCGRPGDVPQILRARRDIGLIVSDVLMPGITGPALIAAIRELHPHIPVLFVTGFAGDIDDAAQFAGCEVLRKPFTLAGLAAALDRVLGPDPDIHARAA